MNSSTELVPVFQRYDDAQFAQRFAPQVLVIERCNFPLWSIIGIPGGIFSILIWSSRPMRRGGSAAAAVYQTCLGVGDVTFFLVYLTWHLQISWHMRILDHPVICEAFPVFHYCAQYLTATLTLTFTLERFLAICYPFKSQHCLIRANERGALKLMAIITGLCLCVASAQSMFYSFNGQACDIRPECNDIKDVRYTIYRIWTLLTEIVFFFGMPMTCLVLNIFVIRVLKRSVSAKRNPLLSVPVNGSASLNENDRDRAVMNGSINKGIRSSTLTLLCTSFYMIAVQLATATTIVIVNFLPIGDENLTDEEVEQDPQWRAYVRFLIARALIEGFGLTHYAAKFPIYMATSKQFRQEFCRRFCPCRQRFDRNSDLFLQSEDAQDRLKKSSMYGSQSEIFSAKQRPSRPRSLSNRTRKSWLNTPDNNDSQNGGKQSLVPVQSRRRPSPGLMRTVIGPDGARVPVVSES